MQNRDRDAQGIIGAGTARAEAAGQARAARKSGNALAALEIRAGIEAGRYRLTVRAFANTDSRATLHDAATGELLATAWPQKTVSGALAAMPQDEASEAFAAYMNTRIAANYILRRETEGK